VTLGTLAHRTQDESKQNKKHNSENKTDKQHEPNHKNRDESRGSRNVNSFGFLADTRRGTHIITGKKKSLKISQG